MKFGIFASLPVLCLGLKNVSDLGWRGNSTDTVIKDMDVRQSCKGSTSVHHGDPLASGGLSFSERVWLPALSICKWLQSG